jgi:hypothetical protein
MFTHRLFAVVMIRRPSEKSDGNGVCTLYFIARELQFYLTDTQLHNKCSYPSHIGVSVYLQSTFPIFVDAFLVLPMVSQNQTFSHNSISFVTRSL